jgi:hypothetical protein
MGKTIDVSGNTSNLFDIMKNSAEDRAINKKYLEERDFANTNPYLNNFSGDPFLHLHEHRT